MVSILLTPPQESVLRALMECGYYGNVSEVGRAAFEQFVRTLPAARKQAVALHLFRKGDVTVSRFAEIADLSHAEALSILRDEGVLRPGLRGSAEERLRRVNRGVSKYK